MIESCILVIWSVHVGAHMIDLHVQVDVGRHESDNRARDQCCHQAGFRRLLFICRTHEFVLSLYANFFQYRWPIGASGFRLFQVEYLARDTEWLLSDYKWIRATGRNSPPASARHGPGIPAAESAPPAAASSSNSGVVGMGARARPGWRFPRAPASARRKCAPPATFRSASGPSVSWAWKPVMSTVLRGSSMLLRRWCRMRPCSHMPEAEMTTKGPCRSFSRFDSAASRM